MELGLETLVSPYDFEIICKGNQVNLMTRKSICVGYFLRAFNDFLRLGISYHKDFPRIVFKGVHNAILAIFSHDQFGLATNNVTIWNIDSERSETLSL